MNAPVNYKNFNIIRALSLIAAACLLSIGIVYAQPEGPASGGTLDGDTTAVPFNGGVSLLVAAAVGYGAKKAYDAKRKEASLAEDALA